MTEIAIRVENMSKQYRIGGPQAPYRTIRESLVEAVQAPFRRLSSVVRGQSSTVSNETIWALRDVSFEVKQGEVVGIIGRNGAGKTTLLKILSRITEPTEGCAEIHGRVGSLLEVGTGFHPELTGRENIYLNGAILGMKRVEIERKFDEIVDFSGVEKFIDTPVKHYSSGMHVRLAFSVAAHLDPEILLVDEVLAVGDAEFQRKCLGKMQEVTGEGRAVLFVSHNMPSIEALCHWAILLEGGRIVFHSNSAATVAYYLGRKDLTASSYTDLHTHPGRTTKSKPIFRSIRILNHREEETAVIQVGDGVIFEIVLEATEQKLKSPCILIVVLDSSERQIARFLTEDMVTEPFEVAGQTLVRCYWDVCRLAPGKYTMNLKIREPGRILDTIWDAAVIEVHRGDVYGTGKLNERVGLIIPGGRWEFKSLPSDSHVCLR